MIRWQYVLTRLLMVVVAVALLGWGLGPVVNYVTIRSLESITGAKVEIGSTTVGLFPPSLRYRQVHVADPRRDKELSDAVTADSMDLILDGNALLHRRLVVRDGHIRGLKIGAKRTSSGALNRGVEPPPQHVGPSLLGQLLAATTDNVSNQADAIVANSETLRQSKAIRQRWERKYEQLLARARKLEQEIRDVRDRARGVDNPLRDWAEFERTLASARDARAELLNVHQELNALPQQFQTDLIKLDEAKRNDIAQVDQFVPGDWSGDWPGTSDLGVDILTTAVRAQIQQVRSYLDGGRAIADYTVVAPEEVRFAGVDHLLERVPRPALLVQRCEIGGTLRADGEAYALSGVVENLTPTPTQLAEPTRTRMTLQGPHTIRVEFVQDRRGNADVDLLTVHWPGMNAESMQLGDNDDAGIGVDGGIRELWVQLRAEGDQIEGRFVSKQTGVRMNLHVDPKFAESAAVRSLQQSLSEVDRIEIDARFAGTWRDIDLQLNTNLGQIMRRATRDAVEGQIRQTRALLVAKIDHAHAEQTAQLRHWLSTQQGKAVDLLATADKSIEELSAKVFHEVGAADKYLGKLRDGLPGRLR
jgi:uncharacterized protein (TIGR03545 family)